VLEKMQCLVGHGQLWDWRGTQGSRWAVSTGNFHEKSQKSQTQAGRSVTAREIKNRFLGLSAFS